MKINNGNKWKIILKMYYYQFKYLVMSFKFFNITPSFQDYIHKIFVEKLYVFVIVYLKNIFIYSKDLSQV